MSDELTLANERQMLRVLLERISLRIASEQGIESRNAKETAAENVEYQQVFQHLTQTYESEQLQLDQDRERELQEIDRRCQTESAVVQAEYQRILSEAEARHQRDTEAATKERDESNWMVSSLLDDDTEGSPLQRLQLEQANFAAAEIELSKGMESLESNYVKVVRFLQRAHMWTEPEEPETTLTARDVDEMKSACLAAIHASEPLRQRILGRTLPLLFLGVVPLFAFSLVAAAAFGLIWTLLDPSLLNLKFKSSDQDWILIVAGISAVISFLSAFFLHVLACRRTLPDLDELLQHQVDARYSYAFWERTSKTELNLLEAECSHLHQLRVHRRETAINTAETKLETRLAEIEKSYSSTTQYARSAYPARLNALQQKRVKETEQVERKYAESSQKLVFRRESDFRMLQAEFDKRVTERRRLYQQSWLDLIRVWQTDLTAFERQSEEYCATARSICPPWNELAREKPAYPDDSPPLLSLGMLKVNLDDIEGGLSADPRLKVNREHYDLPVLLPLREKPSLILKVKGKGRDEAVKVLQSTMLRFLTSLPPGKSRFTILDPVGLGANFAAFMHLADFDELLVTSRIWTEPSHIEKKLADLTEHMETVIQTYLRNEFPTIDDYNKFAGEVAEPYRVLVIANFPANFTDVALRRLMSIAEGGQRCGVYLLLSFDQSQELSRGFAAADLEKHATVLEWTDQSFRIADPELCEWPIVLDQPPPMDQFGQIVRLAGQHSRDVRRVEVPFDRVAPQADQFWASDSRSGIDIPVGRAGATKLQYLRLGKGTSQHVLVAGKTGSGKSTLLHALITNLALYYSPAEVEFYLIDFKKGVEFKVYAEHRLPHARVIAIESDREFGVSVLERLDLLLRDRGEKFREVGVQDIAGYRNARPDEFMPRTLLLVDEFQEFFIEDDAMSQQAALLLDRLVRQGRAFGVHVLLGSQTLAGAYSLARSTLGQIAVRIALQCSETDAHLILSEENTAARLLTRPGEAIYNDANGLIEGNHPFQIVWLGEDKRATYLNQLRREVDGIVSSGRTAKSWLRQSVTPPVVFEGNIPADLTINKPLQQILAQSRAMRLGTNHENVALDSAWKCWLGDSVSLAGPLEMSFGPREGGNVLVVGRDEQAALGIMSACALSFAAQSVSHNGQSVAVDVLDGSLPNSETVAFWNLLKNVWNASDDSVTTDPGIQSVIRLSGIRETASLMAEMIEEVHRRADEPGPPRFLLIFDLARFRDLRKAEEDYGYGGSEKSVSPAQLLTEILRDGPGVGIFTIAWVESFQSAQRWLSRDQLNRFEQRVLFAMNANDSSSLIDSPAASRLGENRGLLYRGDTGTLQKFRPYSPAPSHWLRQLLSSTEPPTESPERLAATVVPERESLSVNNSKKSSEPAVEVVSDELPCIDDLHVN